MDDRTARQLHALGERDAAAALAGELDLELLQRLYQLDASTTAFITRLPALQRRAVVQFAWSLMYVNASGPPRSSEVLAVLYGFQLGHDYALRHGRLLADGTEAT